MASLKFIMDPEVDLPIHETIRAPASFATPLTSRAPDSSAHQGHAPTSGQDHSNYNSTIDDYHSNINKETDTGHPPPPLTAASTTTAASDASASVAASSLLSRKRHPGLLEDAPRSPGATSSSSRHVNPRRRSTTSPDSMDRHSYPPPTPMGTSGRGAGVGGTPAGRGGVSRRGCIGGGMGQLDHPTRPMPPHPPTESPVRLTPITGRISRAKKGQPVHICNVCRPPKTFTRAEHLRRHQLSHQTPGFPCEWPGCDRVFHRHDLLVRHQQKHEQEGDGASSGPRRGSSGGVTSTPTSTCEVPSTPNMRQPANSSSGDVAISRASPHNIGRDYGGRSSRSQQPQDPYNNGEFVLSNSASANPVPSNVSTPTALNHTGYEHHQPRGPINLYVVTQGLQGPSVHIPDGPIPDLTSTTDVSISSPWASSTDSTYSTTPSEARGHPQAAWIPTSGSPPRDWLPPYHTANDPLTVPYPFPSSPHPLASPHPGYSVHPMTPNPYRIIDVTMGGAFSASEDLSQNLHHQVMGVDSGSSAAINHGGVVPRNSISLSSVGSPSPITAPARHSGTLITPSTSLPSDSIGMMPGLGRPKEVMVTDPSGMGMVVSMGGGVSMLGSASYDLGGGNNSPGGGGFLPSQGLGGMGGCVSGPILVPSPLSKAVRNMIPTYVDTYWNHHSTAYPLAHRRMSDESGEDVLRCAMAAVGSQLLDSKEDRNKGIILHDHVVQELKVIAQWNLPIMQAIILCEYFSRFRGRKPVMRPSKRFESLYSRAMNRLSSIFEHASTAQSSPHLTTDQRWRAWLDAEAHRRLLNACFSLDIHTSIYHEHHRSRDFDVSEHGRVPPIPLIGRSRDLWNAQSAEEWDAILNGDPAAGVPLFIPHPDQLRPMIPEEGSASGCHGLPLNTFDRLAILDFEASRLPKRVVASSSPSSSDGGSPTPIADDNRQAGGEWNVLGGSSAGVIGLDPVDGANPNLAPLDVEARISYLFPGCPVANTYLALHHTPLHDLLAVCGDSSMLSQKSPTNKPIVNNRKRIRLWVDQGQAPPASLGLNKSVVKATTYAARALLEFLSPEGCLDVTGRGFGVTMCKISDYWAIYVCALICWSSGHRPGRGEQIGSDVAVSDGEAIEWLRAAAHAQPNDANAWAHIWASRGAIGIVSLVRRRLELDLNGARSRLHSDAVAVLKEIEQSANWRWF